MHSRIVIAGASLGGLRTLEALVAAGFDPKSISIIGAEPYRPYNRPPLSKTMLAEIASLGIDGVFQQTVFKTRRELEDAHWLLGRSVVSASLAGHSLELSDGTRLSFDAMIVATGLSPRRLPFDGGWTQRFVLRTLDETATLRAALTPGSRVVVAGAGFIGCEVAATAAKLGCHVTIVEPFANPMERAIGARLGGALRDYHEPRGVAFRTGTGVTGLHSDPSGKLTGVALTTGETLAADVLVEAVGSIANTQWLEGQALDLSNGLLCDKWMRVESRPDLYAVGDVARFPNALFDNDCRRIEHWCVPGQTAKRAAETLVASHSGAPLPPDPFLPMPSFWSDQHDIRIQSFGLPALADDIEVLDGSLDGAAGIEQGVAVGYLRHGRPIGVVTAGMTPGKALRHRAYLDGLRA